MTEHEPVSVLNVVDNGHVHYVTLNGEKITENFHNKRHAEIRKAVWDVTIAMTHLAVARIVRSQRNDVVRPDGGGE